MKLPEFKISPLLLFATVTIVAIGQVICGTGLYYVAMMAVTMCCIGITYNLLGGFSTMSGIAFAVLGLRLVVISQIAKIIVFQSAEKNMVNPGLTVSVYAVFFISALVGVFIYQGVRIPLPRPIEPQTGAHLMLLYAIAMPVGIVGLVIFNLNNVAYGNKDSGQTDQGHSLGLAMSGLLLFSIVVAIDHRLRKTDGRHSFGLAAFVPWLVATLSGMVNTQREAILAPTLIYFISCYFRGYRMRTRHYVFGACGGLLFLFVISPVALYTRTAVFNGQLRDRVMVAYNVIKSAKWKEISAATYAISSSSSQAAEDYYNLPGVTVLNRFSRIRMDSNLIAACAGYHYGFEALKQDLLLQIPHFLDKNKPQHDSGDFLGRVSGVSNNDTGTTEPDFTLVGDSFGAFSWFGVVVVAMIALPLTYRIYESIFDVSRPWGTVAMVSLVLQASGGVGHLLATLLLRTTIYLLLASYGIGVIVRMIPLSGDSVRRRHPRHFLGPRSSEIPLN